MAPRRLTKSATADPSPVRGRILVLDGDRDTVVNVSGQLTALGFDVVLTESTAAWMARIETELNRGILSGMLVDLVIPVTRGLAKLQIICDRYPQIPMIVMSDAKNITGLRKAVDLGAREFLVKPFDAELLRIKCLGVFVARSHSTA